MDLFQSQSSRNGSWYSFVIKLHNYHATTLMYIVYIYEYILPHKEVDFG